ncbi:MAG: hypothetical protein K0S66_216 [Sphingomonas sp.]|jgi:hypothetical protein|nr:hypothetical protein [Sphingomonas sp.]
MFRRTHRCRFRGVTADARGDVVSLSFVTGDGDDVRIMLATSAAIELRESLAGLAQPGRPARRA